jgi:glutamate--cysteine ligase
MRLTPADLVASYQGYGAPRERWLVGGEYERAVVRRDGRSVGYAEEDGIRWILDSLADDSGWQRKFEGENVIELRAPTGATITLEPGGQVELSGAPHRRLADLAAEVRDNRARLLRLSEGRDLRWIACGLTPYARIPDVAWMPKGRYRVMREYLPRHGELAHWMMKGTCSVQANYDYADEADCARKFHLALDLAPLTVALFANSPLHAGEPTGWQSWRGHIWTRTDPARTGFPPHVRRGYTHRGWVDYLLDTPMMFWVRDGEWQAADGTTFRRWMDEGIDGRFPTAADWELHQTSVFPEVRVKRTIEIRGADAVGVDGAIAFCALWSGLLYSDGALAEARALADRMVAEDRSHEARHVEAARRGLGATFAGRSAAAWARDVVATAGRGLVELGEDPALLAPLAGWAERGRSPAADVLEAYERDPSPENVLGAVAY